MTGDTTHAVAVSNKVKERNDGKNYIHNLQIRQGIKQKI